MSDIIKLSVKLLVITAVAALILGYTYAVTKDPIAVQIEAANSNARRMVLNNASEFKKITTNSSKYPQILEVYEGINNDILVGYTVKVLEKGFGGDLEVLIGIDSDNRVEAVQILSHSETPGLGAKAADPAYLKQYGGIPAESPIEAGDINAVTGATITSNAVRRAVNAAIEYANELTKSGGGES